VDVLTGIERKLVDLIRAGHLGADETLRCSIREDEWPALADGALRHQLAPVLHASLNKLRLRDSVPEAVDARLGEAAMFTALEFMRAEAELVLLHDAFNAEQVSFLLLKGAALAPTLYADTSLRPFTDLDILVRPEQHIYAASILEQQGYRFPPQPVPGFHHAFGYEEHYKRDGDTPAFVDLHWHLLAPAYNRRRAGIGWFWQDPQSIPWGKKALYGLGSEQLFVHLCAHLVLQNRSVMLLRSYDVALWLQRCGAGANWVSLAEKVRQFAMTQAMLAALAAVRAHWGVAPPRSFVEALNAQSSGLVQRTVFAVYSNRDPRLIPLVDLWCMESWSLRLRYLRAMAFPSEAYLRAAQPAALNRPLWILYATRALAFPLLWIRSVRSLIARLLNAR
jgi:hypothetical protein